MAVLDLVLSILDACEVRYDSDIVGIVKDFVESIKNALSGILNK